MPVNGLPRTLFLVFLFLPACNAAAGADAGVDLGLVPFCLGGGLATCTDHSYVPICDPGLCATCTPAPDVRVVCGAPTVLDLPDGGRRLRCLADPGTAPPAICVAGCSFDDGGCPDGGAP